MRFDRQIQINISKSVHRRHFENIALFYIFKILEFSHDLYVAVASSFKKKLL